MENNDKKSSENEKEQKELNKDSHHRSINAKAERKKVIFLSIAIVVILLSLVGYKLKDAKFLSFFQHKKVLGLEDAKAKALDFIDKNLVQPGTKVEVKEIVEANGLYKLNLNVIDQEIISYMTKDGSLFFPSVMNMEEDPNAAAAADATPAKEIPKSDKPTVDFYVMSFCPFGNQAENTMKSVYNLLKNKVDFNFHYIVNSSGDTIQSLHGQKEVDQNEREACVLKNYGKDSWMNFVTYVNTNCGSDGACWEVGATTLKINVAKIKSCVTSQGLALMQAEEKASNEAGATGSPAMFINGVSTDSVYSYGDSEKYKEVICSAFNNAPAECDNKLETVVGAATDGGSC